jgi:3-hydroxyacyl-CoA dehydrogenase/enoyl-CoA hydratase/3-hydroxybutyryl-CoA epimerase
MAEKIMDVLGERVLELGPKSAPISRYHHFRLTRDADGVAWLLFDRDGTSANTLSADVIGELDRVLAELEAQRPTGLVVRSAKTSGFIAGADVNEFRDASDPKLVEEAIGRAHAVIDRLDALRVPTVAVIHGFCLGGGLEVALACQMRIAIDGARFGFPEIMLGLHPGLGGTVRLTRLVNPMQAMTLMLTGRTIDARKAKSLGLVDAVTEERHVRNAVKDAVSGRLKRAKPGPLNTVLNLGPVRGFLASRMRREAEKAAPHEHYPAPDALIDLWERHGGDKTAMLAAEKISFAYLMVTPTAQKPDPGIFSARADEKTRSGRQQDRACARDRRRRDGRRHRGMVRQSGHAGDAIGHEGGADRGRHAARDRTVRQDHAQAYRGPGRARPADSRHARRRRP